MKPSSRCQRTLGQATTEWLVGWTLVLLPGLYGASHVLRSEWTKSKCILQTFQQARTRLIATGMRATDTRSCGDTRETLSLLALEDLDLDKGSLDLGDAQQQVSHYWERFSSWRSLPSVSASIKFDGASTGISTDK